jgi:hypothetical protein
MVPADHLLFQTTVNVLLKRVDGRVPSVGLTQTPFWVVVGRTEDTARTLASLAVKIRDQPKLEPKLAKKGYKQPNIRVP